MAASMILSPAAPPLAVSNPVILLVGCGRMGRALLAGWLENGIGTVLIVEPRLHEDTDLLALAASHGGRAQCFASLAEIEAGIKAGIKTGGTFRRLVPDIVVLAVKPQMMDAVLPECARFAQAGVMIVSIAAGTTIACLRKNLGNDAMIVRAMPNLPASIGHGATVALRPPAMTEAAERLIDQLLGVCGPVFWIGEEGLLDAVTAVSGSGPAYLFLLVETLATAAERAGLPPALAQDLARVTITGAAALLAGSDLSPAALREAVTSPGGTTRAALDLLMAPDGLSALMTRAVQAAAARSRALGQ